jgi:hypothetical protein
MKMIRMAVLVGAATAAASKAKQYARENPEQASQAISRAESFLATKAGPKYADKVGKGSAVLRSGLGLGAGAAPSAPAASATEQPARSSVPTGGSGSDPST